MTLNGGGSFGPDPGDSVVKYRWVFNNGGTYDDTSASPDAVAIFPPGTSTVTLRVTGAHGLTATAATTVAVRDTSPPALAVPADQTFKAASSAGATGHFTPAAATRPGTRWTSSSSDRRAPPRRPARGTTAGRVVLRFQIVRRSTFRTGPRRTVREAGPAFAPADPEAPCF